MSAQAGPGPATVAFKAQAQQSSHASAQAIAPIGNDYGDGGELDVNNEQGPFTEAQLEEYREQDRYLPIANVGRIMKNALPGNAKIAKEAKECVQECVSEFISFLSSEAADKVLLDKRKTINGEDILYSMTALGFDNYMEAGKVYLAKYRNYIMDNPHRSSHSAANPANTSTSHSHNPTLAPRPNMNNQHNSTGFSSPMDDDGEIDSPLMEIGVSPESIDGMNYFGPRGFLSFVEEDEDDEAEEEEVAPVGKKGKAAGGGGKKKATPAAGGAGTKRKNTGEEAQESKKQKKGGGAVGGKKAGKKN